LIPWLAQEHCVCWNISNVHLLQGDVKKNTRNSILLSTAAVLHLFPCHLGLITIMNSNTALASVQLKAGWRVMIIVGHFS